LASEALTRRRAVKPNFSWRIYGKSNLNSPAADRATVAETLVD
jgi:hypothetical protein